MSSNNQDVVFVDLETMVGPSLVEDYIPNIHGAYPYYSRRMPMFNQFIIHHMLLDSRVMFGLMLIKGPIKTQGKFQVVIEGEEDQGEDDDGFEFNNSSKPEEGNGNGKPDFNKEKKKSSFDQLSQDVDIEAVKKFIMKQVELFWMNGADIALRAIEWGYSCSEVMYERDEDGDPTYKELKGYESPNCKVITKQGRRTGFVVDNHFGYGDGADRDGRRAVYIGGPKGFHHVHWREYHPHYGKSRLAGAYMPWIEMMSIGGFRDIRRLWYQKNAYDGGTLYHPQGYVLLPDGRQVHFKDMAQQIMEKSATGGVKTFPSTTDQNGNRNWEYIAPSGNSPPTGLRDYGQDLRIEILEAMGIPYEVIENSGSEGFGSSSGRQIPEAAFYSTLQEVLRWCIYDFQCQVVDPLVQIKFGKKIPFMILPHKLQSSEEQIEDNAPIEEPFGAKETDPESGLPLSNKEDRMKQNKQQQSSDGKQKKVKELRVTEG
jgi:hypothetical protein